MNKQVEQIRAEIERMHKEFRGETGDRKCRKALRMLLHFIDSIPEDSNSSNIGNDLKEQPANEDLEKAASEYSFFIPTQCEADSVWAKETEQHFKDGAQWQREQMMKDEIQFTVCGYIDFKPMFTTFGSHEFDNIAPGEIINVIVIKNKQE